jgi:hypothetical protein
VVSSVPPGWYADPDLPQRRRYWDGAQWTEHVEAPPPAMAPGWYQDPRVEGQQRYWDGAAWTDHVQLVPLFDGEVPLPIGIRGKERHLVVTTEELVYGDDHVRWDEVSWFTQLIVVQNGAEVQYTIRLIHGNMETSLMLGNGMSRHPTSRRAYDAVIGQLRRTLGVRVINGLLDMVDRGETIRTAGLVFSPQGFGQEGKGDLVPWAEFAGIEVDSYEGIWVRLFRTKGGDKRKQAVRAKVEQLHSWAIPPVVEACARRYAGGGGPPS